MTAFASVEVVGLKEALKELNEINPKLRRDVTKEFRKIVDPVIKTAKAKVPQEPPISGWGRKWTTKSGRQLTPWVGSIGDDYIKAKVSGKKPREWAGRVTNLAVFSVAWSGAINTLYDLAGRKSSGDTERGARMIRALEARHGKASRVLWPAYEMNREEVERQTAQIVEGVMGEVNRKMVRG
jgi:hypothetical protein